MKDGKYLYLVDKLSYITENCFQSQLYSAIRYGYDVTAFEIFPTQFFYIRSSQINFDRYDRIISVLRLRTLHQHWPRLKEWLRGRPITIYDQDPWESYIDDAPTKGIYKILNENLNIESVFVTAPWWAQRLSQDGLPAQFIRMGMAPAMCDAGPNFEDRPIFVGFRGAMHEHRKIVFNQLKASGVKVEIGRERLAYPQYLKYLQQLKFFAHDESALPWVCDGVSIPRSTGMWIKSVETASRGTFCLRDYHQEGEAYNLSQLPLIQCYTDPEQANEIIKKIEALPPKKKQDLQHQTVDSIRRQYDWLESAHALITGKTSCVIANVS